jgi:7-carboxy-7-deazaguanine synthase
MDYKKNQPIIELYRAIQTEGSLSGIPHIILRTTGCTHRCYFGEGGWCDSWYTSIHPEKGRYTLKDVEDFFKSNKDINHLMLTGGSPTMHSTLCNEIINIFKKIHRVYYDKTLMEDGIVTIETEGSHFIQTDHPIDLISLSPKFSNSIPRLNTLTPLNSKVDEKFINQHNKFRLNYENIYKSLEYHIDYHFKPVCNPIEQPKIWKEIEIFRSKMGIPKNKTWIMPPGDSKEELLRVYPMVLEFCANNGFNFSGREHILAFGDKREV